MFIAGLCISNGIFGMILNSPYLGAFNLIVGLINLIVGIEKNKK